MMRGILKTSLSFRYLVIIIAGIVLFFGISQLPKMPVDVLPEFSQPYVEIQTEALGLSAEEVEQMITVPMEQDLIAGVAWADVVRSESVPGLSSILISFKPGTDLYQARQLVAERLAQASVGLPHVSKPPTMIQPLSSTSRFMIVGLSSRKLTLIEMSVLARWTIAPRLMGVPGVAHVAIWGQRERQLQVQVDPEKLLANDVSLDQIVETTGNALWVSPLTYLEASSPGTGGFIDTPNQRLNIWHVLPISSPDELSRVPVEGTDGLLLGDLTDVTEDHQPLIGDAVVNNNPNLLLVIEKLPGTHTLDVTRGIETALDAMRPGFTSIDFNATLYRPASYIESALANLAISWIVAALLLTVVLGIFLYNLRTALIGLVSVLVSLVAVFAVLYLRGQTLNTMVLAGLVVALGIVVDEVVVDTEHVLAHLRQARQEGNPVSIESAIVDALSETRGTVFFGVLIALLAVLPVLFLEGAVGALLLPLAISYLLAVTAALVVSLLLTPALCAIFLSGARYSPPMSPVGAWLQRTYDRVLARTVQKPVLIYAGVILLIVAGLAVVPSLGSHPLIPAFKDPYLMVDLGAAPSTSRVEMDRIVSRMSAELQAIPGVKNVGAHVGRAVFGDQNVDVNSAQIWVYVDPQANYAATAARVQDTVDGYVGLSRTVSTYLDQTLQSSRTADANQVTVRVYGENQETLRTQAQQLRQTLAGIQGVADAQVALPVEQPAVEIQVDLDIAQRYGIKPGDVRRTAAVLLSGLQVGSLFEEQKIFDVVVWGTPDFRTTLADVGLLPIALPGGGYVHLNQVASVNLVSAPTVIQREGISSYLDVNLTTQGRSVVAVEQDVQAAIRSAVFPLEYHAELRSDHSAQQAAQQRVYLTIALAVLGMLLFLQASFRNWRLALFVVLTLPALLAGGALAAYFSGDALPLVSLLGLLAVLAIGVRNVVLQVSAYQRIERHEGKLIDADLVRQGARNRVVPTLVTALTTALVLLPFIFPNNVPGHEITWTMGAVIIGGLVTATFYSLFIVPALYLKYGAQREEDLVFHPAPREEFAGAGDD